MYSTYSIFVFGKPVEGYRWWICFDCTWTKDWVSEDIPKKASFDVLWPKDIQDKVLGNWQKYGYK